MSLQFDAEYYLAQYPDVAAAVEQGLMTAEQHWEAFGASEGRNPNAVFVTEEYLAANPDVAASGMNPLVHFLQYGAAEGRAPSAAYAVVAAAFDEEAYLAANADVAAAVESGAFASGYQHWVEYGQFETETRAEATFDGGTPVSEALGGGEEPASELTEALATLASAQESKSTFLEGAVDNETLAENQSLDSDSTPTAIETGINAEYTAQAGSVETETGVSNFGDRSASFQDAAISEKRGDLESDVATKTDAAADGMTALLEDVDSAVSTLEAKLKAEHEADAAYTEEKTVFAAANSGYTVVAKADADTAKEIYFDNGQLIEYVDGTGPDNGDTVLANKVDGEWALTTDGEALSRVDDLIAQYEANEAAVAASGEARTALQDAVKDVLVAETGGYSVEALGAGVITGDTAGADPSVAVDFDATGSTVYDTKADEEAGAGTQEVFTVTFAGDISADGTTMNVQFDGTTVTLTQGDAASDIAAAVGGDTYTNWTASASGSTVTFTAKNAGDVTDTVAGDFTINDDGTAPATPASVDGVTVDTQGEDAGSTTTVANTDAEALADALETLKTFNELVADFENARELKDSLDAENDAIDAADAAITDSVEDGGMGITLREGTDNFTGDDEVYLFNEDDSAGQSLSGFGTNGEDKIFFGEGFSLVEIADGESITDNVGDSSALEIFWDQQGSDVKLYVEAEAFGGNSAGTADVTEITLTGVDAADITDDLAAGFLSAGEVA